MKTRKPSTHSRRAHTSTRIIEACERRLLMSTYTVNTLSDAATPVAGQLTLRQAVAEAKASNDTINFDPTVFTPGSLHTVTLVQGPLEVGTGDVSIAGPGQNVLAISGGNTSRILQIDYQATVSG